MKKQVKLIFAALLLLAGLFTGTTKAFAEETNLIANSSVETTTNNVPTNWTANSWGTNTTTLTQKTEGHTGNNSLYTSMTTHTDGDAKWMHKAVSVTPNTQYTYKSWYKSNIPTEIDLMYTSTSGAVTYNYFDSVATNANWTAYSKSFTTPNDVATVTILQIVTNAGWLQTDDFSLTKDTIPVGNSSNLIANADFELTNGAQPIGWTNNSWGTNTSVFTYDATGRSGKSAKVAISKYTDGDAKWSATPVGVSAGKTYTYSDYYKSGVTTRVVLAFTSGSATVYQELATAPASATAWSAYTSNFTVPTGATKVAVYHLLDKVGSLSIDDTKLVLAATTPTPTPTSTVANASFETANGTNPANWTSASWGTNTAAFSYEPTGRTGTKSAKVTVSNYQDGDAKWMFDGITSATTAGAQYNFSAWYKTNTAPHAVAMYTLKDGSVQYANLPVVQPGANAATTWQQYKGTFTAPANVAKTTVFMLLSSNGWLQTDDYSVDAYKPTGFNRAMLSVTFDDGWASAYTQARPVMAQYGILSTQYIISGEVGDTSEGYMSKAQVQAMSKAGHEIGSHTISHPELTKITAAMLTTELQNSQTSLQSVVGKPVTNLASPYGDYNASVITQAKKYYTSHRTVDAGYNSKDSFDAYALRVQNILNTTTPAQVAGWIKQAQADKTWLILVYHDVSTTPDTYDSSIANFKTEMQAVSTSKIPVLTVSQALAEVKAQL
jgi:peptidoglycan/xylan/chitin deacetylase (PgdA/CDA1 family)